jgi:hypothetical protein
MVVVSELAAIERRIGVLRFFTFTFVPRHFHFEFLSNVLDCLVKSTYIGRLMVLRLYPFQYIKIFVRSNHTP